MTRLIIYFLQLYLIILGVTGIPASQSMTTTCTSKIYCTGKMLHAIQMSGIFADSKEYVDMPTKVSEAQVLAEFDKLGENPSKAAIQTFLLANFYSVGHDVLTVQPDDWIENPPFAAKVRDVNLKKFGLDLNMKWKNLLRKFDRSKICTDCQTSAVPTRNPFAVPGGRFIEYYYWDSYWIIDGLLRSGMNQTAKGMIQNFLDIVSQAGFVPNGARIYYLNRSQPPFLTQMVDLYYSMTKDRPFLISAMPLLDREYTFWMREKATNYTANGSTHNLNYYSVWSDIPRPESYREDYENAALSPKGNRSWYYSNVMSAAESGWDFSSRWFEDPHDIKTIQTNNILPVDLNAILFKNERALSNLYAVIGNSAQSKFYNDASIRRQNSMNSVLWSTKSNSWSDLNIATNKLHDTNLYASNLSPLWAGVTNTNFSLASYGLFLDANIYGIPASYVETMQQWDFPNVWAPVNDIIINGVLNSSQTEMSFQLAQRFVSTVYCGFASSGNIYEKFDARKIGIHGEGGEYIVQEGFGWTNGLVIKLMDIFGDRLKAPMLDECPKSAFSTTRLIRSTTSAAASNIAAYNLVAASYAGMFWCMIFFFNRIVKYKRK